jgi:hypothetical protein
MAASRAKCFYFHRDLEQLLRGFNAAYDARR